MVGNWRNWLGPFKPRVYARRQPLILINGLAEQAESWFCNHRFWRRHFDVHMPNILHYDGAALHRQGATIAQRDWLPRRKPRERELVLVCCLRVRPVGRGPDRVDLTADDGVLAPGRTERPLSARNAKR